jgi:hypothetical protein
MARIFNIYFSYNGIMHNAIVSVRTTPFFTEYTLTHFDEDVLFLLPGNKILSTPGGGLFFQGAGPGNPDCLMKEIIRAVEEHLHATETMTD